MTEAEFRDAVYKEVTKQLEAYPQDYRDEIWSEKDKNEEFISDGFRYAMNEKAERSKEIGEAAFWRNHVYITAYNIVA
jgi:hypothetical protein